MNNDEIREVEQMIEELGIENTEKESLKIGTFDGEEQEQIVFFSTNSI